MMMLLPNEHNKFHTELITNQKKNKYRDLTI